MTDNELAAAKIIAAIVISFLIGMLVGGAVTESRIGSEIRTDQLKLKKDVAEIKIDKATVENIVKVFIFETEQVKLESQRLRDLQLKLSKGEENVKS